MTLQGDISLIFLRFFHVFVVISLNVLLPILIEFFFLDAKQATLAGISSPNSVSLSVKGKTFSSIHLRSRSSRLQVVCGVSFQEMNPHDFFLWFYSYLLVTMELFSFVF